MHVVNLFGAPGAGKSTGAAYIFSRLKMEGVNCELITEYAKDKCWEGSTAVFDNQLYIFAKQYFRMTRVAGKVDVLVTDSPLLLSLIYNPNKDLLAKPFDDLVLNLFNSFDNINFLLKRVKPYNPVGRFQNESESDAVYTKMADMLKRTGTNFMSVDGNEISYDLIVRTTLSVLAKD